MTAAAQETTETSSHPPPRVLFVAWPEPVSQSYRVVGRLLRSGLADDRKYEFVYTLGADTATHFEPFVAFPHLDRVYGSRDLFPFFTNRLMSPKRPDHRVLLERLGLPAEGTDPFDVLVRTGGVRATDRIELFGMPELTFSESGSEVCYETRFLAHGFGRLSESEQNAVMALQPDDELTCTPEPQNPTDTNAMLLVQSAGVNVGYVPRYLAPDAAELHDACNLVRVTVEQVNAPPAPTSQRLLCRLISCVPTNFKPFAGPDYTPRVPGAVTLPNPFAEDSILPS